MEHPDKHGVGFKMFLYRWFFEDNHGAEWAFRADADHQVRRFWEWAGEHLAVQDRRPPVGMAALGTHSIEGYTVRIFRCPEPRYFALNHFVAIARKRGRRSLLTLRRTPDDVRYIALESSTRVICEEGAPPSLLGEWTRGFHINYGAGPEPSEEAFVKSIEPVLADRQPVLVITDLATGTSHEPQPGSTLSGR